MDLINALVHWRAIQRAKRRWRDIRIILILVLICALCNIATIACGLIGYVLQQIGILPPVTPTATMLFT